MHSIIRPLFILAGVFTIASCSDPKAPKEENFRKAINAYFSSHQACTVGMMGDARVGETVTVAPASYDPTWVDLQAAGAIEIKEIPAPNTVYSLSKEPWHTVTILNNGMWQDKRGFCYGTYSVDKVTHWSEPSSFNGMTASRVSYQRKFTPAKWASEAFLKKHYTMTQNGDAVAAPILMNDGWQVPDGEQL